MLTISVWKRAIGYLQTLGTISAVFLEMPLLRTVFGSVASLVSISFPKTAMVCQFGLSTYQLFFIYMSLPSVSLVLAGLASAYSWSLGCRPWRALRLTEEQKKILRKRLITRGRRPCQLLIVAASVIVLFLYPTLNKVWAVRVVCSVGGLCHCLCSGCVLRASWLDVLCRCAPRVLDMEA